MRKWVDLDGKLILQLLTDRAGLTWDELYEASGLGTLGYGVGLMQFYNCLRVLADQGLVVIDDVPASETRAVLERGLRGDTALRAATVVIRLQLNSGVRQASGIASHHAYGRL